MVNVSSRDRSAPTALLSVIEVCFQLPDRNFSAFAKQNTSFSGQAMRAQIAAIFPV